METFESVFSRSLRLHADEACEKALIYRCPMTKYQMQGFDIYSDSATPGLYAAYECKSIDFLSDTALYFSQHFHVSRGKHQLDYEYNILVLSGRVGYLAVELRRDRPKHNTVVVVPFIEVYDIYKRGNKSLPKDYLLKNQRLLRDGRFYVYDSDAKDVGQEW